jgi:hypothetical protein
VGGGKLTQICFFGIVILFWCEEKLILIRISISNPGKCATQMVTRKFRHHSLQTREESALASPTDHPCNKSWRNLTRTLHSARLPFKNRNGLVSNREHKLYKYLPFEAMIILEITIYIYIYTCCFFRRGRWIELLLYVVNDPIQGNWEPRPSLVLWSAGIQRCLVISASDLAEKWTN